MYFFMRLFLSGISPEDKERASGREDTEVKEWNPDCHVVIVVYFVVRVKRLFSQVFCDLGRGRNLQAARVEQAHLAMIMSVSLVAFVTDNAIDCIATHPELAFLWCFIFHVFKISQSRKNARDFFYFYFFIFFA
jgi:hypothetical protein